MTTFDPHSSTDSDNDAAMSRLFRAAGPRAGVPEVRAGRVRASVHAHWVGRRRQHARRKRVAVAGVLLGGLASGYMVVGRQTLDETRPRAAEVVATVEQTIGTPRRVISKGQAQHATELTRSDSIRTDEWIETDSLARVALVALDGTSIRLDAGSRARLLATNVIELTSGAVYIDTSARSAQYEVRTPLARARDLGTQFEVRLVRDNVRLRVRSGLVELSDGARVVSGRVGMEVTLSRERADSRPIPTHGPEWDWMMHLAPPLDIDGLPLSVVLQRVAREYGWTLDYGDPALAREAERIFLHGSVRGLSPAEALDVAITTSGLRHRIDGARLIVLKGSDSSE
jgi:ferric-dicitrate binding protein FerR (iron transport regulator)